MDWSFGDKSKGEKKPAVEPEVEPPSLMRPDGAPPRGRALKLVHMLIDQAVQQIEDLPETKPEPIVERVKRGRGRPKKSEQILTTSEHSTANPVQIPVQNLPGGLNERWNPTDQDFVLVKQLGELGWSADKLYTAFEYELADGSKKKITSQQFAGALVRVPNFKTEYEKGVEDCKGFNDRRMSWQPLPEHIERVKDYAAEGLRVPEIAAKLKVSREALAKRMADTPRLKAAYEEGDGLFRAEAIRKMKRMVDFNDEDLKFVAPMLKFQLQAYCELTDKAPEKPVEITGAVQHNHTVRLATPTPVAPKNIGDFAAKEMARAKEISSAKLLEMKAANEAAEAVDGEVVE
jgi:predicted DNA-binding protein YlxM (UPF0122 family)